MPNPENVTRVRARRAPSVADQAAWKARGAELSRRLDRAGLSGGRLARALGVLPSTVSSWRTGKTMTPAYAFAWLDLYDELVALRDRIRTVAERAGREPGGVRSIRTSSTRKRVGRTKTR